jgi:DNA-binding FadR family transcriptional regulator
MANEREATQLSEFLRYLAKENADGDTLPSLKNLGKQLGISIATLREQLEVARALGVVEVRPKTGIRRQPYQFTPVVLKSLSYAAAIDQTYFFQAYSDLRNHIEAAYYIQAVKSLTPEDHLFLRALVDQALCKLNGHPIQIPHDEHRELHLSIYRHIDNPFVTGILEAYWAAYEGLGLNVYTDISYLVNVWQYHRRMVDAICAGDAEASFHIFVDHTGLLLTRPTVPKVVSRQEFE